MGGDMMPEAVANQQGLLKGWRRYCNTYTARGKCGVFWASMFTTFGIVQLFRAKSALKQRSIKKAEAQKKWNKMLEEIKVWEGNGKKFLTNVTDA